MGCLFALIALLSARAALLLLWILDDEVEKAFHDSFFVPLLGFIFMPLTTLVYALTWSVGGLQGFDFIWVGLAILYDLASAAVGSRARR